MYEEILKDIVRRLQNLENHVINFILPVQEISRFVGDRNVLNDIRHLTSQHLTIDDRDLRKLLIEFRNSMKEFKDQSENLDITNTLGEIKYIGKRLNEIENSISEIKKDGITSKISLNISQDGYDMIKKPKNIEVLEPIKESESKDIIEEVLKELNPRERLALVHRYGLFGEKKKTYVAVGKELHGISNERARQIIMKALRKLRHPKRKSLVNMLTNKELRKDILGE